MPVMNYEKSGYFAKGANARTFYGRCFDGNDFFGMTTQQAEQKEFRDTQCSRNLKTASAWSAGAGAVGAAAYAVGVVLHDLWEGVPSSAEVAEGLASAGQQGAEAISMAMQFDSGAVSFVDPTGVVPVVGGFIFLCRSGLIIHNLQNIDNAMPGSHHNCDHYNLKKVRNCLLEALGIMSEDKRETYSDSAIQELVDKVNKNRKAENDPNKTEIDGFNRFVLKKILKEIGNNGEISNGGLDDSELIKFLTISKSNLGALDFDKLSSEYGIDQSISSKVKAGAGEARGFIVSLLKPVTATTR